MRAQTAAPTVGEKWQHKPGRGTGQTFQITFVSESFVSLRGEGSSRHKMISLRTLRSDYERVPR